MGAALSRRPTAKCASASTRPARLAAHRLTRATATATTRTTTKPAATMAATVARARSKAAWFQRHTAKRASARTRRREQNKHRHFIRCRAVDDMGDVITDHLETNKI